MTSHCSLARSPSSFHTRLKRPWRLLNGPAGLWEAKVQISSGCGLTGKPILATLVHGTFSEATAERRVRVTIDTVTVATVTFPE